MATREQPEEDDCFTNPRQSWQVENPFPGGSYIGLFVSCSDGPPHDHMEKDPQHEIHIKESILRLHSVSNSGTENLSIVSLSKLGYLLLVANGFKELHYFFIFFFFLWQVLFIFWSVLARSLCLTEVKSKLVKSKYHRADRELERWSSAFHCPRQSLLYLCHQGSVRNLTFNFSCQAQHFNSNPLNEQLVNAGLVVTFYLRIYTEV